MASLVLAILALSARGQYDASLNCPGYSDTLDLRRVMLVNGTAIAFTAGSLAGLSALWYNGFPSDGFRFFNDNGEWLQMDKAGHTFSAYQLTNYTFAAYRWAGTSRRRALLGGMLVSTVFLTGVEVLDGFSRDWGFSYGDVIANTAGTALFASQELIWQRQYLTLKFSYAPTTFAKHRPELLGSNHLERILKDYNGQTYWMSGRITDLTGLRCPPWLGIAVGYSASGMTGGFDNPLVNEAGASLPRFTRERQYFLSLDIHTRYIQTRSRLLCTLFSLFGCIKVPAPALELRSGNLHGHWIYF